MSDKSKSGEHANHLRSPNKDEVKPGAGAGVDDGLNNDGMAGIGEGATAGLTRSAGLFPARASLYLASHLSRHSER